MPDRLPPTPTLESDRLVLRPLRTEDAPIIQRRFPTWDNVRFLGRSVPWPYPADGAATHVAACVAEMERGEQLHWVITLKGRDELIGRIDLWPDDGESRDMRGFWLDLEYRGRGFMIEAAERVTEYAFVDLGWSYLWLSNDEENTASRRIKEKQGATLVDRAPYRSFRDGAMREIWRLERKDWLKRKRPSP